MSVPVKKAVVVITISIIIILIAIPVAFWYITLGIDHAAGWSRIIGEPASSILSAMSVLVGLFWITWAYSFLLFVGKGLPLEAFGYAVHPTEYMVTTGPYAYTRNPMVLGMLFIFLGIAFFRGSISGLWLMPLIGIIIYLYLVRFEEPELIRRFEQEYERYRRSVPTLFPRLKAYVHIPE